jgi:hypothetical protein
VNSTDRREWPLRSQARESHPTPVLAPFHMPKGAALKACLSGNIRFTRSMAKLSEEYVIEALNREGFLTAQGIRRGTSEWDIFAIRVSRDQIEARHIEVQVSYDPVSHLSNRNARNRTDAEVQSDMDAWMQKKFTGEKVSGIRQQFFHGQWSHELVHGTLVDSREFDYLREKGVVLRPFQNLIDDLCRSHPRELPFVAGGKDAVEVIRNIRGFASPASIVESDDSRV